MMKKVIKIIAIILLIATVVGVLMTLPATRYGAKIYSDIDELLLPSFKENSTIYHWHDNTTAPYSRTFIVADKETYDAMFEEGAVNVNFEKEMILVYTFNDNYATGSRRYYLNKISVNEGKATVYVRLQNHIGKDAVAPYQRWIAVKMKKADITSVEFMEWKFDIYNGGRFKKLE